MHTNTPKAGTPTPLPNKRLSIDDTFYCRPRRKALTMGKCLDDYMNANAFEQKKSACWRCPQGRCNRNEFSESA